MNTELCNTLYIQIEASRLSNGVTTVSIDSSSPIVHLGVYLGIGTGHETRATAGALQIIKNCWYASFLFRNYIKLSID